MRSVERVSQNLNRCSVRDGLDRIEIAVTGRARCDHDRIESGRWNRDRVWSAERKIILQCGCTYNDRASGCVLHSDDVNDRSEETKSCKRDVHGDAGCNLCCKHSHHRSEALLCAVADMASTRPDKTNAVIDRDLSGVISEVTGRLQRCNDYECGAIVRSEVSSRE